MIEKHYPYVHVRLVPNLRFIFQSIGGQGEIFKIVMFDPIRGRCWNLAFGDLNEHGTIDDAAISNNQDIFKIMSTVGKTVYDFFELHPDCSLQINPVDEKRKRLYNLIFQRRHLEMTRKFCLYGWSKGRKTAYRPDKTYDKFEISLKFEP